MIRSSCYGCLWQQEFWLLYKQKNGGLGWGAIYLVTLKSCTANVNSLFSFAVYFIKCLIFITIKHIVKKLSDSA